MTPQLKLKRGSDTHHREQVKLTENKKRNIRCVVWGSFIYRTLNMIRVNFPFREWEHQPDVHIQTPYNLKHEKKSCLYYMWSKISHSSPNTISHNECTVQTTKLERVKMITKQISLLSKWFQIPLKRFATGGWVTHKKQDFKCVLQTEDSGSLLLSFKEQQQQQSESCSRLWWGTAEEVMISGLVHMHTAAGRACYPPQLP